ncbi:flippase-like domain-containing protein [Clostridium sp. LIBA-8841]|uniref:flippase-like domain-containing protein n=1 Tax=Clostridium sp. LIBA-8841 TaxID=2987530 RepID=UPI002AC783DC|nr:flippase-like domain-containing protein [Clostridium sp. LIBA-8841]MDZ5252104.1 flippase-like domain-containing protein [Clostridium sp. LIBA-8841]
MKIKLNNRIKLFLKLSFITVILVLVVFGFKNMFKEFNIKYFNMYRDRLHFLQLFLIGIAGIVAYMPLSFYDFILKKNVGIDMNNKKLYKYSWIASSIASLLGFGGATSLAFKQYFYGNHVKDKKKLLKEIGKIIFLNLSGLSILCIIYVFLEFKDLKDLGIIKYIVFAIATYTPLVVINSLYKYKKKKEEEGFVLRVIGISFIEWIGNMLLIYLILFITGAHINIAEYFYVYIRATAIGIASMVPGGLGTFDLTFINGFKALGIPIEQTFLVIILYRISYFILPAVIGLILYVHDFGMNFKTIIKNKSK